MLEMRPQNKHLFRGHIFNIGSAIMLDVPSVCHYYDLYQHLAVLSGSEVAGGCSLSVQDHVASLMFCHCRF